MKRLLTYGWLLLTLLASLFVMPSCQEDEIPHDTTEMMMTFTTRAFVEATKGDTVSTHLNEEKMKDLRVIMLRENGEIVGNHKEEGINQTSVTFTFRTPVKTGGEDFTFFVIANEGSITPSNNEYLNRAEGNSYSTDDLASLKTMQIGNGAFDINNGSIPQTKQWTVEVPQKDTKIDNQELEYVASKISVQFINQTNKAQTLKNIKLTGIATPTSGYLFKQDADDFVGTQQGASDIVLVGEGGMTLSVAQSDSVKYYTYPVNGISEAQLVATWDGQLKTLDLDGITSLARNQHLKIIVTLTGQELTVNYTIAPWNDENKTYIGSPTLNGGYDTEDWIADSDIVIGGGEVPGGGGTGEREVTVWGEELSNEPITPEWANSYLDVELSWFTNAATVTFNDIEGVQMYVYFTDFTDNGQMQIRNINDNTQYNALYLDNRNYADGNINNISSVGEKISIFIPNSVINTPFRISGANYTITKVTVVK